MHYLYDIEGNRVLTSSSTASSTTDTIYFDGYTETVLSGGTSTTTKYYSANGTAHRGAHRRRDARLSAQRSAGQQQRGPQQYRAGHKNHQQRFRRNSNFYPLYAKLWRNPL